MQRQDFLTAGLVPVIDLDDCMVDWAICSQELSSPVRLPCHRAHVFCRECIERWLTTDGTNTCPSCRTKLFKLPEEELLEAAHEEVLVLDPRSAEGWRLILQAIEVADFNSNIRYEGYLRATQRAADHASVMTGLVCPTEYLQRDRPTNDNAGRSFYEAETNRIVAVRGRGRLNIETIFPRLIAMAQLTPALARVLGRRYTLQQMDDWDLLIRHLDLLLVTRNGRHVDVCSIPFDLRARLAGSLRATYSDSHEIEALLPQADGSPINALGADLNGILAYVSFLAWHEKQEFERAKRVGRVQKQRQRESRRQHWRRHAPFCAVQ